MRNLVTFLACTALGMLQLLGGVALVGIVAVVTIEHRYFGLPVGVAMFIENLLAWVPLSLLVGALIGTWVTRHALAWSFYTVCVAFGWLLWGAFHMDRQSPEADAMEVWEISLYLAGASGMYLLLPPWRVLTWSRVPDVPQMQFE